jgi:hypothetical protein
LAKQSSLSQQQSLLAANRAELERIYSVTTGLTEAQLERGVLLEKENKALQKNIDALSEVSKTIEDQNNKGKWSGGHTRMTSVFQPRKDRRYTSK